MLAGFEMAIDSDGSVPWKWTNPQREEAAVLAYRLEYSFNKTNISNILSDISTNGTKTMEGWFPQVDRHVFISHSHGDIDIALKFAGWLREEFSLSTFIDSCIWGDSAKLLKAVDNKFCYDAERGTYRYDDRNKSTSHVHAMLTASLIQMMDKCELVIFLNTPNSVPSTQESMKATASPWIMAELNASRFLRRNPRRGIAMEGANKSRVTGAVNFTYELDTAHLITLSSEILSEWVLNKAASPSASMDELYKRVTKDK